MKSLRLAVPLACLAFSLQAQDSKIGSLPGTKSLDWPEEDLSERLMDGAHAFVERQITESKEKRARFWNYDFSSPEAYEKSIEPNRERFRKMIGVVDERVSPVTMEKFGEGAVPGFAGAPNAVTFKIWQVRWPVFEGVSGEGLLVTPEPDKSKWSLPIPEEAQVDGQPHPPDFIIIVPDVGQTPEELIGLAEGDAKHREFVRRIAEQNFNVIIPALIDRQLYLGPGGNDARLKRSHQSHREWIYRQAFHMGQHIIGYEVQRILGIVDWVKSRHPAAELKITGFGEGGLLAFYAAACDPRIDVALVRGYFGSREGLWSEPIDRNVFGILREFGDAEISSLIPPRALRIDAVPPPEVSDRKGDVQSGAPDEIKAAAWAEFLRFGDAVVTPLEIKSSFPFAFRSFTQEEIESVHADQFFHEPFARKHQKFIGGGFVRSLSGIELIKDRRIGFISKGRHERIFRQLENHVQSLVRKSDDVREEFFLYRAEPQLRPGKWSTTKEHPTLDPANFIENARSFRKKFHEEAMGKFDEPLAPPNPRTRKILETEKWTAWDVVIDVYAPEFFAWGTLLLPKDLKPGEKRPVVVCQHGRQGIPRDTIDAGKTAYNDFAAKLAERGFITFAPHNLYRGEDRYRWLDRKANSIGCTLFSFIIPSHRQILDWLKTQPNVDPEKIAFYGLSYGGETAMRVPPVIEDYAVVICSGDFNQWTRKVAATDFPGSFMNTIEWEMPYWNLGNTFDYAEMAHLIFPRPFMVERGHHDRVSRDHWVAHEYAKVRWLYAQFGLADKTEIEYFQGGHSINGKKTFDFLHKHLDWPK